MGDDVRGRMTALARTAGFAALFVVATAAGRLTVLDATNLSLVWPAAGVAVLWFAAQRRSPTLWVDVAAFAAITVVVNLATGASPGQAGVFVIANLLQAGLFVILVARVRPVVFERGLRSLPDLWTVLAATVVATTAGALVGPLGVWLVTGHYSLITTAVWLSRNIAGIVLVGTLGLTLLRSGPVRNVGECVAVTACSGVVYVVAFTADEGLPVASLLISLTVWAGARLSARFVTLHTAGLAMIAVLFTLHGQGPFSYVDSNAGRALIVQLFVTTVAMIGLALALGREERQALLDELGEEKENAAQRATLNRAIIDSMTEGLTVVDSTGRITLGNPSAVRLLGGKIGLDGIAAGSAYYGMFHLDGTPMSDAEMPHARLAAGETVQEMDVLIRNEGVPEGRILQLRATALPEPGGGQSTVLVYHDVTAERRHRDELVAFAGVVAHDLLNPLTAVDGWSDIARESLYHANVSEASIALTRVGRAAGRMRTLINDLLSYTTARDAPLKPVPVDLTALVADIAAGRADAAVAAGAPVPKFAGRTLEPVLADAVLVRQLMENLIGNAIKYTAPGVVPEIVVTTHRRGGRISVAVVDNGIGIPPGQHDRIFATFHRAHTGTNYTGTGLGLAICRRIVERHGSTIVATDNPTGGSRFAFTLPAVRPEDTYTPPLPRTEQPPNSLSRRQSL
ncbi:hypothetical protein GCM10022243_09250 [Saccharothrix violaceirubra]|uniref:Sensor-like histidine kinase SenX3 n=1 Tax=Saccharothrix violaceirubra TaxID=413306 RepID=A0A7W7T460_9PSEU|nr:ATP-binding protein [Saccharothrix violaceirubra]MBB4966238.1 signal transduction histidine kinase [Saccharothrix violaceirubra]